MKNAIFKNTLREMRKSKSRFFSIFGIVAIGVSFFAGVTAAAPDMRMTADKYCDDADLMDFRLVSTYGFDEEDIAALRTIDGAEVFPSYYTDQLLFSENASSSKVARIFPIQTEDNCNHLTLVEGRMPTAPNECLVDAGGIVEAISLGSTVVFYDHEGKIGDTLERTEYTVVGMFQSAMYVDKTVRGSTNVGGGSISTVIYIPEENFLSEYYTQVFVTIPALKSLECYGDEYKAEIERYADLFTEKADLRSVERLDKIKADANAEIDKAKAELADAKSEADTKIADAQKELDEAKAKLDDAKKELDDAPAQLADAEKQLTEARAELDNGYIELESKRAEYNTKIAEAEAAIADNKAQLEAAESEYNSGLAQYNDGLSEYNAKLFEYNAGKAQLDEAKAKLDEGLAQLEALKAAGAEDSDIYKAGKKKYDEGLAEYNAGIEQLNEGKAQLDAAKVTLDETKATLDAAFAKIDGGKMQLHSGEAELAAQKNEAKNGFEEAEHKLADGEAEYSSGMLEYIAAEKKYQDGLKEYEDGYDEYTDGLAEFETEKTDAYDKIADAEREIADAEWEIADLKKIEWYIFDRDDNPGYTEYSNNADRIFNISKVFPVFFILVAMLVCLTTMSRMVEEQRTQIGTLKALGYGNGRIIFKYLFYAVTAAVLGAAFGLVAGMKLFPWVIMNAYSMMYNFPELVVPLHWDLGVISVIACTAAIALTVFASCTSELRTQSAQLMRPKPPKQGKRILLERVTFIWKHFNFSNKVTVRNLFRYKRKMLMSVIGVAGCTALLLTGCALFDSINDILDKQYSEILRYDGIIAYDEETANCSDSITEVLASDAASIDVFQKSMKITAGDKSVTAYIIVPDDGARFTDFVVLRSRQTAELYSLSDGDIYIDEKLSILLGGINAGDSITLCEDDTRSVDVTVTNYVENYPQHYVYMTENTYVELFGELPQYNVKYFAYNDTLTDENALAEKIMAVDGVLTISFNNDNKQTFSNMLNSLSLVIIVIISSAGILAFIVMYNLTNINITERLREIATLKVLGLYDVEVDAYIFRENILLTLIGTAFGLFGGTFLAEFVITTAEVDLVMFGRNIYPMSYLIAALLTLAFSGIVSVFMHSRLTKINMIDALKSVE